MPVTRHRGWESLEIPAGAGDGPVAFGADLSPASVLGAYRHGIFPFPAADDFARDMNEFRYEDRVADGLISLVGSDHEDPYRVAWWSPDPRPVITAGRLHLGRNVRKQLRRADLLTTANTSFRRVAEECRVGREPRWLTDTLLDSMVELHRDGWAHSIEVWQDGDLIGAQWDSPFLRSLGAEPMPRESYLSVLGRSAERRALPGEPLPARRLLGPQAS
jgi:leucyl/phenylalanyl-tRNA---protein transferase